MMRWFCSGVFGIPPPLFLIELSFNLKEGRRAVKRFARGEGGRREMAALMDAPKKAPGPEKGVRRKVRLCWSHGGRVRISG